MECYVRSILWALLEVGMGWGGESVGRRLSSEKKICTLRVQKSWWLYEPWAWALMWENNARSHLNYPKKKKKSIFSIYWSNERRLFCREWIPSFSNLRVPSLCHIPISQSKFIEPGPCISMLGSHLGSFENYWCLVLPKNLNLIGLGAIQALLVFLKHTGREALAWVDCPGSGFCFVITADSIGRDVKQWELFPFFVVSSMLLILLPCHVGPVL